MKKINRILLGLGTIGTVVAPVAAVVACGEETPAALVTFKADKKYKDSTEFAPAALAGIKATLEKVQKEDNKKTIETEGVVLTSVDGKSFSTKDGGAYTAIKTADIADATALGTWATKVKGTNLVEAKNLADDFAKTNDADGDLVTWAKGQTSTLFKDTFNFAFKDEAKDFAIDGKTIKDAAAQTEAIKKYKEELSGKIKEKLTAFKEVVTKATQTFAGLYQ